MAEEETDYSSLPLVDRAVHKLWKVRKEAYEAAVKEFEVSPDESAACFTPWLMDPGLWQKAVTDSNVAAQQEGVTALCAFLQYGGASACSRTRNHVIGGIVEKGLSSTRAITKQKSTEALLLLIELDVAAPVIDQLLPFLAHKLPKIIAATLTAITSIFEAYGAKTVDPKPVLKQLPKLFGHADKNVRAESTKLTIELYKWLKEAMKPMFYNDLKPAQQKELDDAFEKVKDAKPEAQRLLRSQQAAKAAAEAAGVVEDEVVEDEPEVVDAFDLAEPVDINAKIPANFLEMVGSTKWKERKESLDALYQEANVPRIKEGHYDDIIRSLAKCMKDANVAVVTVAANCIEAMATGLRKGFLKYKGTVLGPMLDRLKEKKQGVIDALAKGLDAVFASSSLTECLEDIVENTKHKNPNVKLETMRFLIRCLRTTRDVPSKPEQKQIADTSRALLTDTSAPMRDCAAEAMGTLMKILGERAMNPYMEGLDDIRKTKIKEFFDTATVKAKEKPKPVAPPPAPKAAAPVKKVGAKPGLKGPVKKAAPAAAAPPADEPPKAAPKAIPSKLGARPGLGASRVVKKPGAAAAPAASPKRAASSSYDDEEPAPAPAPKLGTKGGLAGRTLQREAAPAAPARVDPQIAIDKAELEELRVQREEWEKTQRDFQAEKQRMNHELGELRLRNVELIEEHTRDNLALRAKEAQLVRARSDAEAAQEEVTRQKREIERLKRELQRSVRSSSPAPTDIGDLPMNGYNHRDSSMSRSSTRMSYASRSEIGEEREHGRAGALSPSLRSESGRQSSMGNDHAEWKRAAEVTSQLKLRIEQMKLKQGLSGRGTPTQY
ncbi:armadillo-type protein [Pyronema domesticum]|uniref:Similar to Spindle pole body component alp14 acc. no. O94534 n=1 Tax=Pyronema omphalodes (strain CBS 100304) TaxID=1076935 RepID=U4KXD0_PYROM|nr:armadillo-type protein [Pyronema domesticum]CCX06110.1 Similar to Spindle pole body component alp14; acc. no. O94534 [Pyronema omphalodes CBS 100304]